MSELEPRHDSPPGDEEVSTTPDEIAGGPELQGTEPEETATPGATPAATPLPGVGDSARVHAEPAGTRPAELAIARLHLRAGLVAHARVELETLAGAAELDLPGILDLAEVRWRTGDIRGGGEAAAAYLALSARAGLDPEGPLAHVIVAEAAADRGHDAEAAEAVVGALAILGAGLDDPAALEPALLRLFAGIEPRGPWPEPAQVGELPAAPPRRLPWEPYAVAPADPPPADAARVASPAEPSVPSPVDDLLETGRDALASAEPGRAAVALGLALRSDPASAPAVAAAVEEAGTLAAASGGGSGAAVRGEAAVGPDPSLASLAVVHGDALRAAGRDDEAVLAYDLARQLAAPVEEPATQRAGVEDGPASGDAADREQPPGGSP